MTSIAFVIDPLASLNVKKDSTLAMMWAAQRRGWEVFVLETNALAWRDGDVLLTARPVELTCAPDAMATVEGDPFRIGAEKRKSAAFFDSVLMRKDPPFDMNYITTTYLLEQVEQLGVLVVNKPASLRDCNEKFFTTSFPKLLPPQIVASQTAELIDFHAEQRDTIFKPLDGMGGKGIFRVRGDDPNLHVILETLTHNETTPIVGQKFLPAIQHGDKRILLINGEPIPFCLARIPKTGESRGNLAAGGTGVPQPLSNRDREIAEAVGPELVRRGLVFTGIDVIGEWLTEVNVTCPTCIRELDRGCDLDIAMNLLECLEAKLT